MAVLAYVGEEERRELRSVCPKTQPAASAPLCWPHGKGQRLGDGAARQEIPRAQRVLPLHHDRAQRLMKALPQVRARSR